jgi:hypothetical protein
MVMMDLSKVLMTELAAMLLRSGPQSLRQGQRLERKISVVCAFAHAVMLVASGQ